MTKESITRIAMENALARLGELLDADGLELDTVVCGGIVSLFYLRSREMTLDVDAMLPSDQIKSAQVRALVEQVAQEMDLPGGDDAPWFNNSIEFFGLKTRSDNVVFQSGGLKLVSATWEEMLSHKLNAFRSPKDVNDAIVYLQQLGGGNKEDAYAKVEKLCPFMPKISKELLRSRFDKVWGATFEAGDAAQMSLVDKESEEDMAWAAHG